jgi:hypothetical protein
MSALYNFYRPMQQELNSLKPAFWHGKSEQSSINDPRGCRVDA